MHFVGVVWICVVFCSCYQCAIVEIQEGNKMTGESFRLATNSADNAGNHGRNSQSDPRYLDDHSKQLNNLTEVQDGVLEQTVKEKRCKTEGIVGMPSLSLGRRDTTVNLLRKSCENCRSSVMCKSRGKCEGCKKICDRFEIAMESVDEMQMDGPSDENSDQTEILGVENRIGDTVQGQKGLSYGENPYYTVGSFPPGPVHSLLAKLLNIKDPEPIEQLLILAKTKLTRPINSVRPVVIDTAHIFTLNQGGPSKLDVEVHEVKGNSGNINSIASELDREIEKAMEEKRKISGGASRLAPNEIDRIILNAIGQDPKKAPNKPARNMKGLDWDETAARNSDDDTDVGQNFKKQKINQSIPSATSDHQFQRLTGQHRPLEEDTLSQQIPPHLKSGSLAHPPMISSPATQYTDAELSRSNEEEQLVKLEPGDEKAEDVVASEAIEATTIKHKQFPIGPSQNNPRGPKKPRVTSPAPPLTWKYPHGPKESGGIRTTTMFTTIDPKRFPVGPEIGRSNDDSDESSEHEGFTEIPTTIKYKHFPMGPSQNNPRGPKKPRVTSPAPPLTWKYPHGPKESGGIRTTTIFTTIDPKRFPVGPEIGRSNDDSDESSEHEGFTEIPTTIKYKHFPMGPSQNNPRGPKKPRVTSPAPPLTWKYPHGPKESGGIRTTTIFTTIDPKRFPVGPEIGRSNDDSDESSEHEGFTEIPTTIKYKHFPMGPSQNNPRGPKKPRVTSPAPPLTWKYPHGPKESGGIRTTTIFTTIDPKRFPVGPEIGRSNDDSDESSEHEGFTEIPTTIKYKHFPMGPSQNNPRGPKKPRVTSPAPPLTWKYPHGPKESGGIRTTTIFTTIDPKRFPVGPEIGRSNDDPDESSEHEGFTEIPTTIKYKHFPMGPSQNNPRGPKKPRITSPAPPLTWKYPHGPKESGGIRTTTIFTTIDPKRFPVGPEIGRSNDDSDESSEDEGFTEIPTTPETVTVPFGPPNENKGTQELMNSRMMEVADFKKVPARYIVGKKQDASRTDSDIDDVEILKDKYNKLQEWVMRNSHISPPALQDPFPELQEETGNQLAGNVKDIIDSASKINKKISSIVKTDARNPGLVQMVRENDDRLRAMDDDNEHIIGFPNMNKFKTKITPETQRKIDQIFANERPLGSVRKMKDPYEFHPRQESKYRDGTWVYEKIKPNKPPYSTRHRTSTAWKDQQILDGNASNEKSRNSAPTYVDPKLLNMDSVIKGLNNTPRMYYDKANRVLGVEQSESRETHTLHKDIKPIMTSRHRQSEQEGMQADESSGTVNKDQESQKNITQEIPGNIQDHDSSKTGSAEGESYESSSETKNKSNETVACSKEEEEEMLEVLHLHPMSYGGYRSSEHDGSSDRHPNQASGKIKHLNLAKEVLTPTNDNLQSQHPLKHIADQTEKMIDSLNKMHKHGKTIPDEIPKYQARNEGDNVKDEEQLIPFQEPLIQPGYFSPQSPSFAPMRTASEMAQESMDPNFMEQPMLFGPNTNNMEQEFIGVPAMGNRMQKPYSDLTHMGKFIPRDRERRLSLHSRDVSEQEKSKNMYFIGDGIKLPLNMKEHNDGSLHLSVDVKSLCNCKHCRSKQFENGTIILEAMPLTEKEREEHEEEMKTNKALERNTDEDDERGKTTKNRDDSEEHVMYVDAGENLEDKKIDLAFDNGDDKVDLSKRSARTKNSLKDNEIDSSIYSASEEDPVIPLKRLSRQEILDRLAEIKETEKDLGNDHMKLETNNSGNHHDDGNENKMDTKFNLISNVLDFMKKVTLDVRSKK